MFDSYENKIVKRRLNRSKEITSIIQDRSLIFDPKYANEKRNEIALVAEKYHLEDWQRNGILKYFLDNRELKNGSIIKTLDFISYILTTAYGYTDEDITNFLRKNSTIMRASYSTFRTNLAIFNSIGLFEEALFKNYSFLGHNFEQSNFGPRTLYALITEENISNFEELRNIIERTSEKRLIEITKKYPLTKEDLIQLDKKLLKKIQRMYMHRNLEERRAAKLKR